MSRLALCTLLFLLALAPLQRAKATLEVAITVSGEISEIQDLLAYIEERNRQNGDEDSNPLKINFHSVAGDEAVEAAPRPAKLATPQLSADTLTPGQAALVTIAVRDDRHEVDTLAIQVVGTNLKGDLYDDGTHGDLKAGDSVWSVTLTPVEATPAGDYELIVTGFDSNGLALLVPGPDGEELPLEVRTTVSIVR